MHLPPPSHSHEDHQTSAADHLEVPTSGRNFLISPPGSPPVGWQQLEEDTPNTATWHPGDEPPTPRSGLVELDELKKAAAPDEAWADELARALRFLSVDVGGEEEEDEDEDEDGSMMQDDDDDSPELGFTTTTTHLVLAPAPIPPVSSSSSSVPKPIQLRPAVTVSSPVVTIDDNGTAQPPTPPSTTATPPPAGASRITSVKATIEAMLPRRGEEDGADELLEGRTRTGGQRFIPTARPPVQ